MAGKPILQPPLPHRRAVKISVWYITPLQYSLGAAPTRFRQILSALA